MALLLLIQDFVYYGFLCINKIESIVKYHELVFLFDFLCAMLYALTLDR